MASIFDILGSALSGGRSGNTGGPLGNLGGALGNLGGTIGSVLESLSTQAKSAQSTFNNNITQKGGLGSMLGAGALGALLGNVAGGNLLKNAALLGAGAVALNFYKKWAEGQKQPQQANSQQQSGSQTVSNYNSQSSSAALPQVDQQTLELVTRAMVYAAKSDGNIDADERECVDAILANMLPGQNVAHIVEKVEKEPVDPGKISAVVRSKEQGEDVYRLSCSVINIDQYMERAYLDALAKSLDISDAEKNNIENEAMASREKLLAAIQPA